ncbi:MAG TPA: GTPase HflX [Longimicrobiales bacterium]
MVRNRREQTITPTITNEVFRERAVLVGAPVKVIAARAVQEHLDELARLATTAGAEVVGTVIQRLDAPHPRFYIGEGKASELKRLCEETGADVVLFDDELSPAQGKALEDLVGVRVLDRTELILDIFATRARTSEAQMQVELAQLEYLLPRLKRMWTHLERTRGGIGLRGPGETQLETDRRLIRRRIGDLRAKLRGVEQRRATQRKGRSGEFRAALVGYTNAGKSSILRALSGSDLFVEDRLFATLDPATRAVELGPAERVLVTDTVGFIRKLPHHLVASFRATLEEAAEADVLLHVIDASHPEWEAQKEVVEEVLTTLELSGRPVILVFNKVDQLTHTEERALRERVRSLFARPSAFASTIEPDGLAELRSRLREELRARRPEVHLRIPIVDGQTLAAVYREGEVLERIEGATSIDVIVRLPLAALGRLQQRPGVHISGAA